ncbi:hypothetical protein [Planctomicrobium piriforme]|uniref:hypothetical protein n=1 Tax=Planctomicrobium piriforme TaxID=1576369 RepID=UPI000B83B47C|nr:hypothetical protein [Planctomicrobium piriforme]
MDLLEVAEMPFIGPFMAGSRTDLVDNRFHLQMPMHGLGIVGDFDGRVSTIFFYSEGMDGYRQFAGDLPDELQFQDSKECIHEKLGPPSTSGGGEAIELFGRLPKWDRYDRDESSLHIQYLDDETSIGLVSLMRPDSVP